MEDAPSWRSRGYLPHIEGGGFAQFLTWRLDDSAPAELIQQWREEIAARIPEDSERKRELYRRMEAFLDQGCGSCVLRNAVAAQVVQGTLLHHHGSLYELHDWVVMPNHVHCLLTPLEGVVLGKIVHANKSYTATAIHKLLGDPGRLWQPEYFDRFIRDEEHFRKVGQYIRWNPVKAKLCSDPKHWPYSSASYDALRRLESAG